MKRRPGFTIIEMLTVVIILGLLAVIAISRFWAAKDRTYFASLKSDLRTVAIQQERYFSKSNAYASDPNDLPDIAFSPGVTVTMKWTDPSGWAATAEHESMLGRLCGYFTGPAPAGIAEPATDPGSIACDE